MTPQRREYALLVCALLLVALAGVVRLASRSDAAALPAGIEERSFTARGSAGNSRVTAVGVSLSDGRYRERPMMTHGKRLSQLHAVAAIDGDFYNLQTGQPSGRLVINGAVRSGSNAEPSIVLHRLATTITRYPAASAVNVISGKPRLIIDGERVGDFAADGATRLQVDAAVPRSAVAVKGGELWLLACGAPGLTMAEWARALQREGFDDALNLDGGPSTGLVLGHRLLAGQDAQVPTALAISSQ
jgi:hypothetical protein